MNNKQFCPQGHDKAVVGKTKWNFCRACHNEHLKAWRSRNPKRVRIGSRNQGFRKAGIINADGSPFTYVNYDYAYQTQQGSCAGCGTHQSELGRSLDADHDHKTGIFRFLLCANCNRTLGYAKDNPTLLRKLADMVERVCTCDHAEHIGTCKQCNCSSFVERERWPNE